MTESIADKIAWDIVKIWMPIDEDGDEALTEDVARTIACRTDPMEESARVHCENAIYWNAQAETARKKITTLREALNKALDRAKLIDKKKLGYVDKGLVIGVALACEEGLGKQPEKSDEVICEICGAPTEGKSICSPCYSAEVNG